MTWLTLQLMQTTLTFSHGRYGRQSTSARLRPFGLASLGLSRGSKPKMKASHKTLSFLCAYASFAYAQGHKLLNDFKTLKSKSQKLKPPSGQASKAKSASLALSYKSIKARASNPRHLSSFGYRGFSKALRGQSYERLASLGDKSTKDERLKRPRAPQCLRSHKSFHCFGD
jgi:hypothetical protein